VEKQKTGSGEQHDGLEKDHCAVFVWKEISGLRDPILCRFLYVFALNYKNAKKNKKPLA